MKKEISIDVDSLIYKGVGVPLICIMSIGICLFAVCKRIFKHKVYGDMAKKLGEEKDKIFRKMNDKIFRTS